jgi:hypothetical protein
MGDYDSEVDYYNVDRYGVELSYPIRTGSEYISGKIDFKGTGSKFLTL